MFKGGTKAGSRRRSPGRVAGAVAVVLCGGTLAAAAAPDCPPPLQFPKEGRWSIATDWRDGWPSAWVHAREDRLETVGDWTLFSGRIELPEGSWILRDAQRPHPEVEGLTELRRRWIWDGEVPIDRVTLSIRFQFDVPHARPFLPGISYYDNPAGQSVDPTRIPVIGPEPGSRGFYEEHRYPLPFAALEAGPPGALHGAALHSRPSPAPFGRIPDQWWSLGLERLGEHRIELGVQSGATASNGRNSVIKANQRSFIDYPDAWLTVPPGAVIEKTVYTQVFPVTKRGHGFRPPLWTSVALFDTGVPVGFPPLADTLRRKFHDTTTRWIEQNGAAGFDAWPDTRGKVRRWLDLGWAGQSEAAAYPLLALGESMGIPDAIDRARRSVDFMTTAPFDAERGFAIRYDFDTDQWQERTNPLSQGQAMANLLNALRLARTHDDIDTQAWETFLAQASAHHADRILAEDWRPVSTNEGFLIAPLAQAADLFDKPRFLAAARKAADHYGARHESMDEPYWGGTLDARCEDKEGAWAALQGFLALYETTKESGYLDWATQAADVIVSYVYVWDVALPAGRLADNGFRTRGWTSVSVQNMHLDVYGVLCAPALWRLGELTGRTAYQDLARLMTVSCGQLVDPTGRQGEQIHQTNYAQHYRVPDLAALPGVRGDYVESWDIFWITAHFLTAAAQFEELGVAWETW